MKMWKKASAACLAGASLLVSQAASAVSDMPGGPAVRQLNLTEPVTKIAEQIHWLNWMMLIICTVIFVAVFGVMFYSIFKHRKSKGAKSASFHESITVEVVWTIVPFLIVIAMALPATKTVVAMKDTTNSDITIKATGTSGSGATTTSRGRARASRSSPRSPRRASRSTTSRKSRTPT